MRARRADLPDVSDSAAEDQKKCVSFMASRDKRIAKLVFKLVGSEVRATDVRVRPGATSQSDVCQEAH